jgi:SAM-dependent MidA family methyltransferase
MASSPLSPAQLFAERFSKRLDGRSVMSFATFMDLALYDPKVGYYRSDATRIGRNPESDFYTAEAHREVYSALVAAGALSRLNNRDPQACSFVEIGVEPGGGLRAEALTEFRSSESIRIGDTLRLPDRAVCFSNELFDAQPFHRVVRRGGQWIELGVRLDGLRPVWADLDRLSPPVDAIHQDLPDGASDGYTIDLPISARGLMRRIVSLSWRGVFIAVDYGKDWPTLCKECPEGTGRAYRHHRQHNELLANPGKQDLTCHICWDWLVGELQDAGFTDIRLDSQESFFMKNATGVIQEIISNPTGPLDKRISQLRSLLHPGIMGQKFQVLSALRQKSCNMP